MPTSNRQHDSVETVTQESTSVDQGSAIKMAVAARGGKGAIWRDDEAERVIFHTDHDVDMARLDACVESVGEDNGRRLG